MCTHKDKNKLSQLKVIEMSVFNVPCKARHGYFIYIAQFQYKAIHALISVAAWAPLI